MKVSTVIPCYNEERFLERCIEKSLEYHENILDKYEIIIVEDGCTDNTPKIANNLSKKYEPVKHLHFENRLGKGKALEKGFDHSKGKYLFFYDTDLATDLKHLKEAYELLEKGYDAVIGSRNHEKSKIISRNHRKIIRKTYKGFLNLLFKPEIKDLQCGFKGFQRSAYEGTIEHVKSEHMFWDTELMVKMQYKNHKIKEIPIKWTRKPDSKTRVTDVFPKFPKEALRVRKELKHII